MMIKKSLIAGSVGIALGLSSLGASAATITHMTFGDVDGDGSISGFFFQPAFGAPTDNFPNGVPGTPPSDLTFGKVGEVASTAIDTSGQFLPGTFTTGFNFGGGGIFTPSIQNGAGTGSMSGTIDAVSGLSFTSLDFAGLYNGTTFFLAPENPAGGATGPVWVAGDAAYTSGGTDAPGNITVRSLVDNTDGTYDVVFTFSSLILSSAGDTSPVTTSFDGSLSRWRIESCISTTGAACVVAPIPVPAAVWLFGSGLLGLVGVARRKKNAA